MKKKILIVEDNPETRDSLTLSLQRMGYEVLGAQDSKEAIACAIAEQPDLILMDLGLPDVDGIKTTAELRRHADTSHIPVVALTSWFHEIWKQRAIDAGVVEFLTKPALPMVVKEVIQRFTQRPSYDLTGRFPDETKCYR